MSQYRVFTFQRYAALSCVEITKILVACVAKYFVSFMRFFCIYFALFLRSINQRKIFKAKMKRGIVGDSLTS